MSWLFYIQKWFVYLVNKIAMYKKAYTYLFDVTGIMSYIHKGHYVNFKYQGCMNLPVDFGDDINLRNKTNIMRCFQMCRWICYAHIMETSKTFNKYISKSELYSVPHDNLHLHNIECCKFNNIYYSTSHTNQLHSLTLKQKKTAYLVFSGTQFFDIEAWAMNCKFQLSSVGDNDKIEFHTGYVDKMLEKNKDDICLYEKLHAELSEYSEIYVSGHSMGAAFALLFSYLHKLKCPNTDIHATLCALPRVCNKHFTKQIKKMGIHCVVYIHPYDCVRILPFSKLYKSRKKNIHSYPGTVIDVTTNKELNIKKEIAFFDMIIILWFGVYYHTVDRYIHNFTKWYKIKRKKSK